MRQGHIPRQGISALLVCVALAGGYQLRGEVPAILFVVRDGAQPAPRTSEDLRPAAAPSDTWSQLILRESNGTERVLLENQDDPPTLPTDFADPDVSYDGKRVVFSGYSHAEKAWRLFEVGVDGNGFRQLTRTDRELDLRPFGNAGELLETYDDLDPCYLPDGRICLSSTRYPGIAPDLRGRTTNLYVMEADGSALHRITTERYGADTPTVDPTTGQIVYSRWWRSIPSGARLASSSTQNSGAADDEEDELPLQTTPPGGHYGSISRPPPLPPSAPIVPSRALTTVDPVEFSGLNSWFLSSINPDGTGLAMHSGFHLDRELTQAWRPSLLPDGRVAALFVTRTPFTGVTHEKGLRVFYGGIRKPDDLGGPNTFADEADDRVNDLVYASVAALPDSRLLVTAAKAEFPTEFDLYVQDAKVDSVPERLESSPFQELDAVPIVVRQRPPVIPDTIAPTTSDEVYMSIEEAYAKGGSFQFVAENIFGNSPVDVDLPAAPPLGHNLLIEFYMAPQRDSVGPRDRPLLIAKRRVPPSGRVAIDLPANVPLFEVLRTADGQFPQGRDRQIYHVGGQNFGHAGVTARCIGCHTGHSTLAVPEDPSFTNIAPGAEIAISGTKRSGGEALRPENLVDRDTTPEVGEWTGRRDAQGDHWFSLSWAEQVEAQELVLYTSDAGIESAEVSFLADAVPANGATESITSARLAHQTVDGPLLPTGTRVQVPVGLKFRALHVALQAPSSGNATIAEIEVVGRSVEDPFVGFRRGDADCNKYLDMTDAFAVFGALFMGSSFCCESAADVDSDGTVNLADALSLLNYLFLNGPVPAEPFSSCGETRSPLPCEEQVCPAE